MGCLSQRNNRVFRQIEWTVFDDWSLVRFKFLLSASSFCNYLIGLIIILLILSPYLGCSLL